MTKLGKIGHFYPIFPQNIPSKYGFTLKSIGSWVQKIVCDLLYLYSLKSRCHFIGRLHLGGRSPIWISQSYKFNCLWAPETGTVKSHKLLYGNVFLFGIGCITSMTSTISITFHHSLQESPLAPTTAQ